MSTYTPPASGDFDDGDPFDASKVLAGFTSLATAINADVNSANITGAAVLEHRVFHAGAVKEVWSVTNRGLQICNVVPGNTGTAVPIIDAAIFDIPETGIDFYLRANATVTVFASVCFLKAKTIAAVWPSAAFEPGCTPQIILDGSIAPTMVRFVRIPLAIGVNASGMTAQQFYSGALTSGRHRVHAKMFWSTTTVAAPNSRNVIQFIGVNAGLTVLATYA